MSANSMSDEFLGRRNGQRRGQALEKELLRDTLSLIFECGYEAFSIDLLAARTAASKATIYKRWPGKAELVQAAWEARPEPQAGELPDCGELRADLIAVLTGLREGERDKELQIVASLLLATRHDARLSDLLEARVLAALRAELLSPVSAVIARAIARGRLPADSPAALVYEVCEALLLRRVLFAQALDADFLVRTVTEVLMPLLESPARPGPELRDQLSVDV